MAKLRKPGPKAKPDDPKVLDLIEGAAVHSREDGRLSEPVSASQEEIQAWPWEDPKLLDQGTKLFNLRLSPAIHTKLQFIASQHFPPKSIHQVLMDFLEPAIEREIRKLTKK